MVVKRPTNNFVVTSEESQKGPDVVTTTTTDFLNDFLTAVRNNTQISAMRSLARIMELLDEQLSDIKKETAELRVLVEESRASKSTSKRPAARDESTPESE